MTAAIAGAAGLNSNCRVIVAETLPARSRPKADHVRSPGGTQVLMTYAVTIETGVVPLPVKRATGAGHAPAVIVVTMLVLRPTVGLGEGLLILGWVAMWRPVEILLFEHWESHRDHALLKRLAGIPIEIVFQPDWEGHA